MTWHEFPAPEGFAQTWRERYADAEVAVPRFYEHGGLRALVGREPVVKDDWRWHVSVSGPDRIPTWEELVSACHELRPGVVFCIPMPPRTWWINVHKDVLHAWETRDEHLIAEWRRNARGDRPT
jgi:hypothetical protein